MNGMQLTSPFNCRLTCYVDLLKEKSSDSLPEFCQLTPAIRKAQLDTCYLPTQGIDTLDIAQAVLSTSITRVMINGRHGYFDDHEPPTDTKAR